MSKFRYPGVNPFNSTDVEVFFGRNTEVDKLYTKIITSDTVVLHATSGTGKSSLINAKIIPKFKESDSDYVPLLIDMAILNKCPDEGDSVKIEPDNIIINEIIKSVRKLIDEPNTDLPFLLKQKKDLWYWFKLYQWRGMHSMAEQSPALPGNIEEENYGRLKDILLVFDQFESIEALNYIKIKEFAQKLSQLFSCNLPKSYYTHFLNHSSAVLQRNQSIEDDTIRLKYNQEIAFLQQPLNVKALFVVKEDKFGTLSLLSDYFPNILKNEYKLLPLERSSACDAIVLPAQKEGDFASPRFCFAEDTHDESTIDYLLNNLANKETGRIDPIEIQIVMQYVERKVIDDIKSKRLSVNAEKGLVLIPRDYLPPINDILSNFYTSSWHHAKLKETEEHFQKNRKQIIEELVVNDRRIPIYKGTFSKENQAILQRLEQTGLIRKIIIDGGEFCQLCHDRFIKPLNEDLTDLKAKEDAKKQMEDELKYLELQREEYKARKARRTLAWIALGLLGAMVIALAIFSHRAREARQLAEEEKYFNASRVLKNSNPTLSYTIADQWRQRNDLTGRFETYLKDFETSEYSYAIIGVSHISPPVIAAQYSDLDSAIVVADKNCIYEWNPHHPGTWMLNNKKYFSNRDIVRQQTISGISYFIIYHPPSSELEIINTLSNDEKRFKVDTNLVLRAALNRNIDISSDRSRIAIGRKIYSFSDRRLLGSLPKVNGAKNQIASIFMNDSRHLIAGYEGNHIYIFDTGLPEFERNTGNVIDIEPPEGIGTEITSLALTKNDKYLFVGYVNGKISRINLGNLIDYSFNENQNYFKGHTGSVNHLNVSGNSKWLLSGSDDFSAILWDIESGERVSVLKGRDSKVNYVSFSDKDLTMITGTEDGFVYLWKKEVPSKLKLLQFSPFDYYRIGLDEYDIGKLYDTSNAEKLFTSTVHYFSNLPIINAYPEDKEYLKILEKSINEVKAMYNSLSANPEFLKEKAGDNKWILDNYYINLLWREQELLLKTRLETDLDKNRRSGRYYETSAALLDSKDASHIERAISIGYNMSQLSTFFFDEQHDYTTAEKYSRLRVNLLRAFYQHFPKDTVLQKELTLAYWDHSWNQLFVKDFSGTIRSADSGRKIYNGLNGIITNLALGYLLNGDFEEARKIYWQYRDSSFSVGSRKFRDGFLKDLEDLKPVIDEMGNESIKKQVVIVQQMLNE